jgi:hypothetical protein
MLFSTTKQERLALSLITGLLTLGVLARWLWR